ncbi:MAG TPA: hypothetical protein DIC64_03690 [Alphaproteobacteria bacterium]|nr:hypothetical protein [Alphaproteobacteria bacterium]
MTKELNAKELAQIEKFLQTPGMEKVIKAVPDITKQVGRRDMFRKEAIDAVLELNKENEERVAKGKPELTSQEKQLVFHNGSVRSKFSLKKEEEFKKEAKQSEINLLNETYKDFGDRG